MQRVERLLFFLEKLFDRLRIILIVGYSSIEADMRDNSAKKSLKSEK